MTIWVEIYIGIYIYIFQERNWPDDRRAMVIYDIKAWADTRFHAQFWCT